VRAIFGPDGWRPDIQKIPASQFLPATPVQGEVQTALGQRRSWISQPVSTLIFHPERK